MSEKGSDGSNKNIGNSGNTSRIPPSIHWVFTFNNYSKTDWSLMKAIISVGSKVCICQEEIGESGTPHLQGYIHFKKKIRPKNMFDKRIHWEKARSKIQSMAYCQKDDTRRGSRYIFRDGKWTETKMLKIISELLEWQKKIIKLIDSEPDDRSINWYWEPKGGVGKTALCKYICHKYDALICSGKCSDMKYGIINYIKTKGYPPKVVIFDVPRYAYDYISYGGMEEIKNGLFFSPKYESEMCLFNCPHVIVFANQEPEKYNMSLDRWRIEEIE